MDDQPIDQYTLDGAPPVVTNVLRARWFQVAVRTYARCTNDPPPLIIYSTEFVVLDLLVNLLFFC